MTTYSIIKPRHWSFRFGHSLVILVWALVIPASARADLLADGSPDMYWVARVDTSQQNQPQTFIQSRSISGEAQWKLISQISQRAVSITHRDTQLFVLLDSGDWMQIYSSGGLSGALPEDGAKLLKLAAGQNSLWAIASSGGGRKPTTAGATQPAATMPAGSLLLYRLDRGQWKLVSPLPVGLSKSPLDLIVQHDMPVLAAMLGDDKVHVFSFNDSTHAWDSLGELSRGPGDSRLKLFVAGSDRLALWLANASGAGEIFWHDADWSKPITLPLQSGAPTNAENDLVIAGQSVRLLILSGGKITEQAYGFDGSVRGKTEFTAPSAPTEPRQYEWLSAASAAVLVFVLMNSMRHRTTITPEDLEAADVQLASYTMRLIAGIIDLLPIIVTFLIIGMRIDPNDLTNNDAIEQALRMPLVIASGIYLLHTLFSEMIWGVTIGKMICGLRVANIDGSAPSRRAIFLRNILRVVDLVMFFTLLIVLISPLRQRVGDITAETIVISK